MGTVGIVAGIATGEVAGATEGAGVMGGAGEGNPGATTEGDEFDGAAGACSTNCDDGAATCCDEMISPFR